MILDRIQNWPLYFEKGSRVGRGMQFLVNEFDPDAPDGRVDIDGNNVFALIQGYSTRAIDDCRFEAHRVYLDIQYVFQGAEIIGWTPTNQLTVSQEYDEEKDLMFFHPPEFYTSLEIFPETFALFYPGDAHMPGIQQNSHNDVRKVVVKVRL